MVYALLNRKPVEVPEDRRDMIRSLAARHNPCRSVLDKLETPELLIGQTKKAAVAVIQSRQDKTDCDRIGSLFCQEWSQFP